MNVFITGVGSGIGKATALMFLKKNHSVIGVLRNPNQADQLKQEAQQLPGSLQLLIEDLNDPNFIQNISEGINRLQLKTVDILLNIAGVLNPMSIDEITPSKLSQVMNVNFTAPMLLIQELLPLLKKSNAANVVNITSMSGYQNSVRFPGLSVYGASKAALASITQSLAVELQQDNIHINALALGAVNTEMLQAAFPDFQAKISPSDMANYLYSFAIQGCRFYNGQVLPVAITNP